MEKTFKLTMLGKANIATQLDEGHRLGVRKHNDDDKNWHILSKIIECIKFCGALELATMRRNLHTTLVCLGA